MRVLLFESNLMWSAKLVRSIRGLGHDPLTGDAKNLVAADVAVINLGELAGGGADLIARLHAQGTKVIAHAGHKEKDLLALGKDSGADILASNSQLTFKLPELLERARLGTRIEDQDMEH